MADKFSVSTRTPTDYDMDYQAGLGYHYDGKPMGAFINANGQEIRLMGFAEAAAAKDMKPDAVRQLIVDKLKANNISGAPDDETVQRATNAISNVYGELKTMAEMRRDLSGGTAKQEMAAFGRGEFGTAFSSELQPALAAYDQAQGWPPISAKAPAAQEVSVGGDPSLRTAVQQGGFSQGVVQPPENPPAKVAAVGEVDPQRIREAERGLKHLGYYHGPIDGIEGRGMHRAERKFAHARKLDDASLTPEFMKALDEALHAAHHASRLHASEATHGENLSPKHGQGSANSQPLHR